MELAPFSRRAGRGCQGFSGPLPSAFLDKLMLNKAGFAGLDSKIY
jgi:hypothetical protein